MEEIKKIKIRNFEAGFSQAIILIILIAGLAAAVFLVQKTQIFKPRAFSITTAEFIDSTGNPITQTADRNVRLRIIRSSASITSSPTPVLQDGKDYGDGTVWGQKPPGGFWDDNGPNGPGWYLPTDPNAVPKPVYTPGSPDWVNINGIWWYKPGVSGNSTTQPSKP
ncbi:hypothetical protein A3F00_00615 [Candidatus Daviesbacteria bacterium RIFCSPHIGHO2_12_FULL_37_11]|uniref:Uncharacterized protein n=1 Tax=Candidatus Daviesbacteria bacterium RIFCSPHIGHO2_12_FULL_37_11 TaxID=1797777 RepID=A0A1F5KAM3_9BACT|nr:MAG: hypothetical protein A2769_01795 [Candidatus Daviesbacteria bacterium RIFCSPHIGHO2_01_FULL_37_27]OGE37860.1 MAG: hypothetical protein A3F00_00615 [Candidatus Daviesbacteria bacterium RIFCSPHIGHO2_12_FULL_37_11]OGE45338.1 MAG: hypothetical protein A3B39_01335 [Candidatus Daviesbacteria bacterium RIFCSPLOWO2_01_FULL_37_10]